MSTAWVERHNITAPGRSSTTKITPHRSPDGDLIRMLLRAVTVRESNVPLAASYPRLYGYNLGPRYRDEGNRREHGSP
jgi:hypothetical protein